MHHKSQRRTLREFCLAGWRKYVVAFVAMLALGALGLASAAWFTVPTTAHGNAYGKGQNSTAGVAVTGMDFSADGTCGGQTGTILGPSSSGFLCFGVNNSNTFAVTLSAVAPTAAAKIIAVGAPTCTATPGTDFTVTNWAGPAASIPATGQLVGSGEKLAINTTATFPSCLAGVTFSLALDLTEAAT